MTLSRSPTSHLFSTWHSKAVVLLSAAMRSEEKSPWQASQRNACSLSLVAAHDLGVKQWNPLRNLLSFGNKCNHTHPKISFYSKIRTFTCKCDSQRLFSGVTCHKEGLGGVHCERDHTKRCILPSNTDDCGNKEPERFPTLMPLERTSKCLRDKWPVRLSGMLFISLSNFQKFSWWHVYILYIQTNCTL